MATRGREDILNYAVQGVRDPMIGCPSLAGERLQRAGGSQEALISRFALMKELPEAPKKRSPG
jgi:hypothetical protein